VVVAWTVVAVSTRCGGHVHLQEESMRMRMNWMGPDLVVVVVVVGTVIFKKRA
jgi:uncharacterized membrane protein